MSTSHTALHLPLLPLPAVQLLQWRLRALFRQFELYETTSAIGASTSAITPTRRGNF